MTPKELSELSDQELLDKAKKLKSIAITNALLIGFMVGIILFSIVRNTVGVFTFIPLFFIFKIVKDSKDKQSLESILKERKLN